MVDLLRAVIKTRGITQTNSVGGGEQAEIGVGFDDFVLVHQRQFAICLKDTLDNEHNVGTSRVVFVKHNRDGIAQCPRQNSFVEFRNLNTVAQFDRVFADQVDTADMRIQVHPHRRPVQPRADLFDVRRFTGAVIALHHDAAVVTIARQNRQRSVWIKFIGWINHRHTVAGALWEGLDLHVRVDAEHLTDRNFFGWFHHRVKISVGHMGASAYQNLRNCCGVRDATYSDAPQGEGDIRCLVFTERYIMAPMQ